MKNNIIKLFFLIAAFVFVLCGCKKNTKENTTTTNKENIVSDNNNFVDTFNMILKTEDLSSFSISIICEKDEAIDYTYLIMDSLQEVVKGKIDNDGFYVWGMICSKGVLISYSDSLLTVSSTKSYSGLN